MGGNSPGGSFPGGNFPGEIHRGGFTGWEFTGGSSPGGNFPDTHVACLYVSLDCCPFVSSLQHLQKFFAPSGPKFVC